MRDRIRELKATAPIPKVRVVIIILRTNQGLLLYWLASSVLGIKEVLQMFGLRQGQTILWESLNILRVQQHLEDTIARILNQKSVTLMKPAQGLSWIRFSICSVYEEGTTKTPHAYPCQQMQTGKTSRCWNFSITSSYPTRSFMKGEKKLLNGFAGCTIFAAKDTPATNLVIVEAQRQKGTDFALAQLGRVHGGSRTRVERKITSRRRTRSFTASRRMGADFRVCRYRSRPC